MSCFQFCNKFLDLVNNTCDIVNTLLISDETHLYVSGFTNKKNCHYWALNNPHEHQQRLPHNAKVTAWCSISSHVINGPPFFKNAGGAYSNCQCSTVQSNAGNISAKWVTSLSSWFVCFQQDGATAHMAQMQCKFSVQCFQADSSFLVLGDITWLTRLPDHTVLDYFLSGNDKTKV